MKKLKDLAPYITVTVVALVIYTYVFIRPHDSSLRHRYGHQAPAKATFVQE